MAGIKLIHRDSQSMNMYRNTDFTYFYMILHYDTILKSIKLAPTCAHLGKTMEQNRGAGSIESESMRS